MSKILVDRNTDEVAKKVYDTTIIAQKVPENTTTASGKIISIINGLARKFHHKI